MAASYPSAAKSFTPIVDAVDYPQAAQVNAIYDEVTALETALLTTGLAHDLKFVDATYDLGKSGATRPRDGFFSRNVTIGGTLTVSGITKAVLASRTTAGVTTYLGIWDSTTETDVYFVLPCAGTIKNLYIIADGAIGAGQTATYTVRKNGVDQTLTTSLTGAGSGAGITTNNDATHSFTVVAGDLVSIKLVTSAGASTRKHQCGMELATT